MAIYAVARATTILFAPCKPPKKPWQPDQGDPIMNNPMASLPNVGDSVRRVEDARFLTGTGQYVDDIHHDGQKHAVFVRSPHAHATIDRKSTRLNSSH